MNRYGSKSREHLDSADPQLQRVFEAVLPMFDHTVTCGERGKRAQLAVAGKTSKVTWPDSKHNNPHASCGGRGCNGCDGGETREQSMKLFPKGARAVDAFPHPIRWGDTDRMRYFAGHVMGVARTLGIRLRWGGDWDQDTETNDQRFNDLGHFEIA